MSEADSPAAGASRSSAARGREEPRFQRMGRPDEPVEPSWKGQRTVVNQERKLTGVSPRLFLVGDSIAKNWPREPLSRLGLGKPGWLAVAGYFVENVLWRVQSSAADMSQAELVIVAAGTNNLSRRDEPGAVCQGIIKLVEMLKVRAPQAAVVILEAPPQRPGNVRREAPRLALNALLANAAEEAGFRLLHLQPLGEDDYVDNIHLAPAAYAPLTAGLARSL